jgi:Pyruvate/2-oxoacid:ferredoxin oxidoreductase delta subunit
MLPLVLLVFSPLLCYFSNYRCKQCLLYSTLKRFLPNLQSSSFEYNFNKNLRIIKNYLIQCPTFKDYCAEKDIEKNKHLQQIFLRQ